MTNMEKDSLRSSPFGSSEWEDEGGALARPSMPGGLPAGIDSSWTLEYRVGPYRYSRLADAEAELKRRNEARNKPEA
ncbi:hypothetical protein [Aurantiacibacter hainanensis]|uniref:hypothetical protein n=1 Tax=Aurantiacibacter hainanensis TaxID=3076114 RepID=UPI0030C6E662